MDNYFIFKDIDSRNMAGLIVCTLPPITKPAKRYSRIEIDGRDGDITIAEGYEAYDKEIEIGLTRGYDINKIITWLNGSGKLIMSNENDKYYEAEVVEQIDFERLLRFKTAKIKFHVQPYKYKLNESNVASTSKSVAVTNQGLVTSLPIITINGSGSIVVSLNGVEMFTYTFPAGETSVVLDSKEQNAHLDGVLKNRNMNGDFIELVTGLNAISITGTITNIKVEPRSRWL